jgi:hypothetical protein
MIKISIKMSINVFFAKIPKTEAVVYVFPCLHEVTWHYFGCSIVWVTADLNDIIEK